MEYGNVSSRMYNFVYAIIISSILLVPLSNVNAQPPLPPLPTKKLKTSRSTTTVKQGTLLMSAVQQQQTIYYTSKFSFYLNNRGTNITVALQNSTNLIQWNTVTNYRWGMLWTNGGRIDYSYTSSSRNLFWRTAAVFK